ncbi:transcriptional regulator [Streptomyces acidiscabies]|uniref:Tetratricopeptide repeat protein n=1 Tax=Streptomyces acidiscabies TaxID=42234 RepID=A0ABU4LS29_9ACTN|nr:transcriptional regulator [Streptomyces acidiscabies]MBP5941239.1 tetratricopeptide repeat protein [Streptomyces sp. LBUM 1476]MDX3018423.1 tetratricopeptide repeat protein [Streptomyces acidiscabies]GAV46345.1 55.5 kDa and 49.5 kDa sporulation proteins [Streptomyces acidiscabies]
MKTPEPNTRLERLYRETGWTLRQFAQEVNRIGTERRTPMKYREPSVHQWLKGHLPREVTRPLILEALTRKLRRPITHSEASFPSPSGQSNIHPSTVDGLVDLGTADMDPSRRSVIGAGLFSVALAVPNWRDVVGRMEAIRSGKIQRIGMPEVDSVTAMTGRLSELDDEFGGRYARPMAAAFLVNIVAPYLKADAPTEVRREMMSSASFLCYLTGWMAVDEGLHGSAQQYYVKGLELAGASDDHLTYCHILRGMSVQSVDLGHGSTAVTWANAASEASPTAGPRMKAFMAGQQAHSYAVAGDRYNALQSIRETEAAMSKAESRHQTFGGYSPATLTYHTAQVRYAMGDVAGSVDHLQLHFRLREPANESTRSGMRFSGMLAEHQLEMGYLDEACATWSKVLDGYPAIQSGQVDKHVKEMSRLIRPHLKNSTARDLYERARLVAPNALAA